MKKFILILLFLFVCITQIQAYQIPDNLYKGLIAEDTSGDYKTYLAIASVVRNRLQKGMTPGLVALKRKDLDVFVAEQIAYVLKTKQINLESQAKNAIREVLELNQDYSNGATHYEHTKVYGIPSWAKSMEIVKILYGGTERQIIFYRERKER